MVSLGAPPSRRPTPRRWPIRTRPPLPGSPGPTKMFSGRRSWWTIPRSCAAAIPSAACRTMPTARSIERSRPSAHPDDPPGDSRAASPLGRDPRKAGVDARPDVLDHVRVRDPRDVLPLLEEPLPSLRPPRDPPGEHRQRPRHAVLSGGLVQLRAPVDAEQISDLVPAELGATPQSRHRRSSESKVRAGGPRALTERSVLSKTDFRAIDRPFWGPDPVARGVPASMAVVDPWVTPAPGKQEGAPGEGKARLVREKASRVTKRPRLVRKMASRVTKRPRLVRKMASRVTKRPRLVRKMASRVTKRPRLVRKMASRVTKRRHLVRKMASRVTKRPALGEEDGEPGHEEAALGEEDGEPGEEEGEPGDEEAAPAGWRKRNRALLRCNG